MSLTLSIILAVIWAGMCVFFTYMLFYEDGDQISKEDLPFRLLVFSIVYSPLNIILGVAILGATLYKGVIVPQVKKLVERYKFNKERKQKIKLGIIKITSNDPYGEENWNE